MGLILIQTKGEINGLTAEAMASMAEEFFHDQYQVTRWLWSAPHEDRVVKLVDRITRELNERPGIREVRGGAPR